MLFGMKYTTGWARLDAGEKESRGSCFLAQTRQDWVGERPGTISLTVSTNFPVCSNGLSVTCATSVSDSDKTKNGRHPIAECRPL